VIPLEDCITGTSRRLDSNTEAVFELVFIVTIWLCLEDACLAVTGASFGTDRGTEDTGLSIKLCSLWTTFDVA
jgi:hypothetical protein